MHSFLRFPYIHFSIFLSPFTTFFFSLFFILFFFFFFKSSILFSLELNIFVIYSFHSKITLFLFLANVFLPSFLSFLFLLLLQNIFLHDFLLIKTHTLIPSFSPAFFLSFFLSFFFPSNLFFFTLASFLFLFSLYFPLSFLLSNSNFKKFFSPVFLFLIPALPFLKKNIFFQPAVSSKSSLSKGHCWIFMSL